MNFKNNSTFQGQKVVPSKGTNPGIYNSNNIIVFSESVASAIYNTQSSFNNQLKESRAMFKYFVHIIKFYIESALGEFQLDTAIIQVGKNDLLNNTTGT